MKRIIVAVALLALAGCGQGDQPSAESSAVVESPTVAESSSAPTPSVTQSVAPTPSVTSAKPTPTTEGPGDESFCGYLEKTADAQQQVEDPAQFVALVEGAQAVAPGAISEDLALYVTSVRKLAATVTGSEEEMMRADRWLTRNEAAVAQAEANLNSYTESTCGRPFILGEG